MSYVTECEVCHDPILDCQCAEGPTIAVQPSHGFCPLCHQPRLAQQLWALLGKDWPDDRMLAAIRAVVTDSGV